MEKFDRIIFGDNQFFGINHMSQEKAQQLSEKFYNFQAILDVYQIAIDSNIRGIMLNSNDRASAICDHFVSNKSKYPELNWYPSIPYPHKYANLVSEKGIVPTINEILFKDNSAMGILGMITKGTAAVLGKDAVKLMQMLVDLEMKMFKGLNVKVVFLQNIITDLLLGYEVKDIFYEYEQKLLLFCKNLHETYLNIRVKKIPNCDYNKKLGKCLYTLHGLYLKHHQPITLTTVVNYIKPLDTKLLMYLLKD